MLFNLFARNRTAPTGYEKVRLLFHGIRTIQLISSIIVGSIVSFFLWWLIHDHIGVPWTFAILVFSSFLTVICLTTTIAFHCLTGLSPRLNLILNSVQLFSWALGFIMLTRWAWGTITGACDAITWHNNDGVMVCQTYKALYGFGMIGLLATTAALILDIHIHNLAVRMGKHMRLDNMGTKPRVVDARPGRYGDDDLEGRHSEAFEVPRAGYGARPDPAMTHQSKELLNGEGYAVKDSHFEYDTGYRGGHAERVFGVEK
ncbi:hypothetical protein K461DRAFT_48460 [Myriangium duriaei CBS 260.36]|uniref:MARVEL domain-containing protein n=1 Tax=Myriangium duriaei CBS 260.36 TaxID=1168546 RepID=A0A9P4IW33_9PEZI|nr:hypothetical protein K461DRAFT_48460 [Myriangium duriaei CBS 260.36]